MTSPTQLGKRIQEADYYEQNELTSLPSIPPSDSSLSENSYELRPQDGYDVGIREISQNTGFVSRTQLGIDAKNAAQPLKTPAPSRPINQNFPSGRSTSHLTSTPASLPLDRRKMNTKNQFSNLRTHEEFNPHETQENQNAFGIKSPEASRIIEDQAAQSLRENMILASTSSSESEAQRKPKSSSSSAGSTSRPEDFASVKSRLSDAHPESDESESFASKTSLGDVDLSALDDMEYSFDMKANQLLAVSASVAPIKRLSSSPPRSAPSPVPSNKSSSQSTLIAQSPKSEGAYTTERHVDHLDDLKHSNLRTSFNTHLSSPGIGRRDSPHARASNSFDELQHGISEDLGMQHMHHSASHDSSYDLSSFSPQREKMITPQKYPGNTSGLRPTSIRADFARRQTMLSHSKAAQPAVQLRSAKRTHVPRRLAEAADDTSELSGLLAHAGQASSLPDATMAAEVVSDSDSTAHDLTTRAASRHLNGNTSFPTNDKSQRFNGPKLANYLHSLNTRLTEENHNLCDEIERLKRENDALQQTASVESDPNNSQSFHSGFPSHKAAAEASVLQREIKQMKATIEQRDNELRHLQQRISNLSTSRDSEQPEDDLMQEIDELKNKLATMNSEMTRKNEEIANLKYGPKQANSPSFNELQAELARTREDLAQSQNELDRARQSLQEKEEEFADKVASIKNRVSELMGQQGQKLTTVESELQEMRHLADTRQEAIEQLQAELQESHDEHERELQLLRTKNTQLEGILNQQDGVNPGNSVDRGFSAFQAHTQELDEALTLQKKAAQDAAFTAKRNAERQDAEIQRLQKRIKEIQETFDQMSEQHATVTSSNHTLEQALNESERTTKSQESELAKLRSELDLIQTTCDTQALTIKDLEKRLAQALETSFSQNDRIAPTPQRRILRSGQLNNRNNEELNEAYDEIKRLKAQLATPIEKVDSEILKLKIDTLETHRAQLEERVRTLRQQASALVSTPGRSSSHSYLFKSIASLRTPKSPNRMLANMTTFAHDSSLDNTITPMLNEIYLLEQNAEKLRQQLNVANEAIDKKIDHLAKSNEHRVQLAAELSESKSKVKDLEGQLDRLLGSRGTINKVKERLADVKCPECDSQFDANQIVRFRVLPDINALEISFDSESITGDTYNHTMDTHSALNPQPRTKKVQQLEQQLETKKREFEDLVAKHEADEQDLIRLQEDLERAHDEIDRLKADCQDRERLLRENDQLNHVLKGVEERLRQTEVELSKARHVRDCTDAELRALQNLKGESDSLSKQLSQAQTKVKTFEKEKSNLEDQQAALLEEIEGLKNDIKQVSNSEKRNLEKYKEELNDLRQTLEMKSSEVVRLRDLKNDVLKDTENLRDDLFQVRTEAAQLAHELKQFKQSRSNEVSEKEFLKVRDELSARKTQLNQLLAEQENHVCLAEPGTISVADQKKHSAESKGLLLRIRFLKLLFTRESQFRADLADQKRIIFGKLRQTETTNVAINLALEKFDLRAGQIGNFTIRATECSFKGAAIAVRAVCRIKILSQRWKEEERSKKKLIEAYQRVRGKAFEP